jgi:hypothetical protein
MNSFLVAATQGTHKWNAVFCLGTEFDTLSLAYHRVLVHILQVLVDV